MTPLQQAQSLAEFLWKEHWQDSAPNWKVADNLTEVLLQIDNMTVGLVRPEDVSLCIGLYTLRKLASGSAVTINGVNLVAADDLFGAQIP